MKMRIKYFFCLMIIFTLTAVNGYNFLLAVPVGNKSLHYLFQALAKALSEAGHTVTTISKYPAVILNTDANIQHIQLDPLSSRLGEANLFQNANPFQFMMLFTEVVEEISGSMWANPQIMEIWKNRNKFDGIITPSYLNEIAFPFLLNYTGIFATFCTPGIEYFSFGDQGNWLSPAVAPNMVMAYDESMSFIERALNLASLAVIKVFLDIWVYPKFQKSIAKQFPDVGDVFRFYDQASLSLVNTHFALETPMPLLPNQIQVGTIAATEPKELPQDIQKFVDRSGDAGVIYFCLGSFAKSSDIPEKAKQMLLQVFGTLSQSILWKYEEDDLDLPPNVLVRKWFPQQDILGHPKTKLFISHCGNLGTQEAKYHGVPIMAVPITFDQPRNAALIQRKGYGLILNWEDMTIQTITNTINILINNTEYQERMHELHRYLHDQKESASERAVWWLEYVVRHKGASHLQYAGKRLHFLQYIMMDVVLFWVVVIFSIVAIVFCVCKRATKCLRLNTRRKTGKSKKH